MGASRDDVGPKAHIRREITVAGQVERVNQEWAWGHAWAGIVLDCEGGELCADVVEGVPKQVVLGFEVIEQHAGAGAEAAGEAAQAGVTQTGLQDQFGELGDQSRPALIMILVRGNGGRGLTRFGFGLHQILVSCVTPACYVTYVTCERRRVVLHLGQIVVCGAIACGLWMVATLGIRLFPASLTDPLLGAVGFALSVPIGWLCVRLTVRVAQLAPDQILAGIMVVLGDAMLIDGVALRWFHGLYSADEQICRLGAAWLLWGYGASAIAGVVFARRRWPQGGGRREGMSGEVRNGAVV